MRVATPDSARRLHGGDDVLPLLHSGRRDAVGPGQLHEVGAQHGGGGVALVVEELLPLPDHAQVAVVDHRDLDVELLLLQGGELALGHLEAAVARDGPDLGVGTRQLGPDGRGQGEAHGAEAARGDEGAGRVVLVVLRLPHLVLAHVGADHRVAAGGPPDVGHHVGGEQLALVGLVQDVAAARVLAPHVDLLQPVLVALRLDHRVEGSDAGAQVAEDGRRPPPRSCRSPRGRSRCGSSSRWGRRS